MSKKIMGVTVGTPISPAGMERKMKPVKTVNGIEADEKGNVQVAPSAVDKQEIVSLVLAALPAAEGVSY